MACWGAQNESSVENGKAFCEKAAGEEAIISWSLFCAISPDTPSTRRVGAECADGSFFFEQVVHHKLFRKRYFIKIWHHMSYELQLSCTALSKIWRKKMFQENSNESFTIFLVNIVLMNSSPQERDGIPQPPRGSPTIPEGIPHNLIALTPLFPPHSTTPRLVPLPSCW